MKLLLDTHIWLWTLLEPDRVGKRLQESLEDAKNEQWLSPISIWEASLLHGKGRLILHSDPRTWLAAAVARFKEAPLTHEIALATYGLKFAHRDPADRFLAATALVLGLTLVTADERLLGLGEIQTLANR